MNWEEALADLAEKTGLERTLIETKLLKEFKRLKTPVDQKDWEIEPLGESWWLLGSGRTKRVIFVSAYKHTDPKTNTTTRVSTLEVRNHKPEPNVRPTVGLNRFSGRVGPLPASGGFGRHKSSTR